MADRPDVAAYKLVADTGDFIGPMRAAASTSDQLTDAVGKSDVAIEKRNKTVKFGADYFERQVRRLDEAARIEHQYQKAIDDANKARAAGIGNEQIYGQVIDLQNEKRRRAIEGLAIHDAQMRKSATSTGLARYEMINLSRQIQDVGVSLAGGQSPFRILVEQGSQIADIFISSKATVKDFFVGIGTSIRSLGSGAAALGIGAFVTTLVVGAGAAAVAWASAQKDVELALLGIGRASGATAQSINEIAKAGATTFGLSISEAREFASILAQTGHIGVEQLGSMVAVGKNLAIVLGTNSTEAAKILGKALAEPGKGIEQLNQSLGQFDAATVRVVQNLVAQNKILEAQKIIMEGVAQATKNASDAVSNSSQFWTALGNAASNATTKVGEFIAKHTGIGQSSQQELERLIAEYQALQRAIEVASPALREALQIKADETLNKIGLINTAMERVGVTAEDARRKLLSMADQKLVRDISPEIAQFEQLKNQAEGLRNLLQRIGESGGTKSPILEEMGLTLQQVQLSANRSREALASALSPAARLTAEFKLQLLSIQARTGAERETVAALQTELALAGQNVSASEKRLAIERSITLEAERQAQVHQDNMAALEDQLAIAQAKTSTDKASAQFQADVNARIREGATAMEAEEEAALKSAINIANAAGAAKQLAVNTYDAANAMQTYSAEADKAQAAAEAAANSMQSAGDVGGGRGGGGGGGSSGGGGIAIFGKFIGAGSLGDPKVVPLLEMLIKISADSAKRMSPEGRQQAYDAAVQAQEAAAQAAQRAAEEQQRAAQAAQDAAKAQIEAAKAAREAKISALDEAVKDIIATKLLAGQSAQAVNMLIEQGGIQFGTASVRFQTQLDLYKRAGMSPAQTAADIRAGIIGEGARPSELLEALDSLTDAVTSNTEAQIGLSEFYTQQGDRLVGYRGFNVQTGIRSGTSTIGGEIGGGTGTGGTGTGGMTGGMGGVVNTPGVYGDPVYATAPAIQYITNAQGYTEKGYYQNGQWVRLTYVYYDWTQRKYIESSTPHLNVGNYLSGMTGAAGVTNATTWHFAAGGIMGAHGPLPLCSYQEGGVANRPQMAMFGEAGPEAFVPLKGGAIPVKLTGSNDNKPTTVVNINAPLVNFTSEPTRDEVRESAFQASQQLRRLMAG